MDSPCFGACALDDDGVCTGCGRTREEIVNWQSMDTKEKKEVLERVI